MTYSICFYGCRNSFCSCWRRREPAAVISITVSSVQTLGSISQYFVMQAIRPSIVYSYMYVCKLKLWVYVFMCISHIVSLVSCRIKCELVGGRRPIVIQTRLHLHELHNRSFRGAGLDPGCPINSIHHAEISGKLIMISISQSMHSCQEQSYISPIYALEFTRQ